MNDQFFPFILRCNREHGWSPSEFRSLFMRTKPKDMRWYGYDVAVLSIGAVEFRAFNMEDAVYGGIGDEIGRWNAEASAEMLRPALVERAIQLGAQRLEREREYEEQAIIAAYANELLSTAQQAAR